MTETYYTIRQVAERLSVHYQTIWGMVRRGELESTKIRSTYRIPESAVLRLTQHAQKTEPVKP